jgi:hypothetical protein
MPKSRSEPTSSNQRALAFGAYLATLLDAHGSSARTLASALDIDVSLVYKWLRGERTPARNATYLDTIDRLLDLDTKERRTLRAARDHSLKLGRPKQSVPKRVASLVARIVNHPSAPEVMGKVQPVAVSDLPKDGAIAEAAAMQEAAIALIAQADEPSGDGTLAMSFQSEGSAVFDRDFASRAVQAIRGALSRKWRVEHIMRLDRDLRRTVPLVESMLDLLAVGDYRPYRLMTYEPLSPPYDLLIRPDAALLLLATHHKRNVDAALLTRDTGQIALLRQHFALMCEQAKPLLQSFRGEEANRFGPILTEAEENHPGRVFVKYGLSLFTEPASWSRPDSHCAQMVARDGYDVDLFIAHRDRRLAAFAKHVRTAVYRDICPMEAVEMMVHDGYYMGTGKRDPLTKMPVPERKAHLENLVRVLREQENFELALVEADRDGIVVSQHTFWEVVGGTHALVNTQAYDGDGDRIPLEMIIDEPTLGAAFQHYFDSLWERISPRNRDKDYVIWWLERQLEGLPA